ncbi:prepilin peptidase, partial [bacterium]|nr:prepilin peptidase [bacterium]
MSTWFLLGIGIAIIGGCWGSFLGLIWSRLKKFTLEELKSLCGRSICDSCRQKLAFKDLIPIFSFLWLRGRCRYCGRPIPWELFLIEL